MRPVLEGDVLSLDSQLHPILKLRADDVRGRLPLLALGCAEKVSPGVVPIHKVVADRRLHAVALLSQQPAQVVHVVPLVYHVVHLGDVVHHEGNLRGAVSVGLRQLCAVLVVKMAE